nr:MAG TPA: hypothetical protein [Caudoviricetes sp.]
MRTASQKRWTVERRWQIPPQPLTRSLLPAVSSPLHQAQVAEYGISSPVWWRVSLFFHFCRRVRAVVLRWFRALRAGPDAIHVLTCDQHRQASVRQLCHRRPVQQGRRHLQQQVQIILPYLKATTLSLLGKAKLFELVAEDDDDLAELADGGTVAGLTLDDVDRMSVRELRQALREARETNAAQQRVLADKNEKIDSLSTRLEKKSRIQPPEPDEEVKKLRAEVTALAVEAESAIAVRLSSAFETLCAYCAENMIDTPRDFMAGLVCQLESTARSLRSTFDLPDEPTGNAAPSWLTEPTPQINGLEA